MRIRSLAAGIALAALAAWPVTPAAADPDHIQTLRQICEAKDGDFYVTPFARARCQATRPSDGADDGLRSAFMICTMQLAGTFHSAPTYGTFDGTTTWICI